MPRRALVANLLRETQISYVTCKERLTLLMQAWGGDSGSDDGGAVGGGHDGASKTTVEAVGVDTETMLTPSTVEAVAVSLASCVILSSTAA